MKTLFFTDPHIGLNRLANTTPASRAKLRQVIFDQVYAVVTDDEALGSDRNSVCVGDLFDTYSNAEADIENGYQIVKRCDIALSGNHDVCNRADSVGSLQFLSHLLPGKVWNTPFGQSGFNYQTLGYDLIVGIPHVASQTLFEKSLEMAMKFEYSHSITPTGPGNATERVVAGMIKSRVLLLHCNYESPFAEAETTLNLTEAWATKLLERYDYVILGHEHQPRDLFGGRLVILGNTHPTSFADISDKRVAILEDGKLTFKTIWRADDGYRVVDHSAIPTETAAQFVRVTGEADAAQVGAISRAIAALWKSSPSLLAVKLDVKIMQAGVVVEGKKIEIESLPATIRRELEGTDMLGLFNELMERAA